MTLFPSYSRFRPRNVVWALSQARVALCPDPKLVLILSYLHSVSRLLTVSPPPLMGWSAVADIYWKRHKRAAIDHMLTDTFFCHSLFLGGCKNPTAHLFYDVTALMIGWQMSYQPTPSVPAATTASTPASSWNSLPLIRWESTAALLQYGSTPLTLHTPSSFFFFSWRRPPSTSPLEKRVIGLFGTALPLCSLPGWLQEAGSAVIRCAVSRGRHALHSSRGSGPGGADTYCSH